MSAKKYCECGAKMTFFLRRKNGDKKWTLSTRNGHELCPRCWRALWNSLRVVAKARQKISAAP